MRPFQNFMIGLSRVCLGAICAAAIAVLATTMPAAADDVTPVETFAQQQVDKGISILTDKSLSPPARQAAIGDFVLSLMDLKRIALYALGPAAQSAPKEDVDAFVEAFKKFTLANYESQLGAYNGETIKTPCNMGRRTLSFRPPSATRPIRRGRGRSPCAFASSTRSANTRSWTRASTASGSKSRSTTISRDSWRRTAAT